MVGKGEIARSVQFLFLPQYFPKPFTVESLKHGTEWERVNSAITEDAFSHPAADDF